MRGAELPEAQAQAALSCLPIAPVCPSHVHVGQCAAAPRRALHQGWWVTSGSGQHVKVAQEEDVARPGIGGPRRTSLCSARGHFMLAAHCFLKSSCET